MNVELSDWTRDFCRNAIRNEFDRPKKIWEEDNNWELVQSMLHLGFEEDAIQMAIDLGEDVPCGLSMDEIKDAANEVRKIIEKRKLKQEINHGNKI